MVQVASSNPLMAGLPFDLLPQPSTFVILGAAGDLARRKLLPALYNLALDGLLPASFAVLGVAMNDMDDAAFRALAQEGVMRFSRRRPGSHALVRLCAGAVLRAWLLRGCHGLYSPQAAPRKDRR